MRMESSEWVSALITEISSHFHHVKTQQEVASYEIERGYEPERDHAGTLTWAFQPPEQ